MDRLYGTQGLLQYQWLLPFGEERALNDTIHALASANAPATLAVLKRLGEGTGAPLSFPISGWTLAADFPARAFAALGPLLDRIDRRVAGAGGAFTLRRTHACARRWYPDVPAHRSMA